MEAWRVNDGQARVLLGSPSRSTFYSYKRGAGGDLGHDALERVSYVLGIYKALQLLFPHPGQADAWPRKSNQSFGGRSALDHALGGRVIDRAGDPHRARCRSGLCLAVFRPRAIPRPVQGGHLRYHFDGRRIDRWFRIGEEQWQDLSPPST